MMRLVRAGLPLLLAVCFVSRGAAIQSATTITAESVLQELKEGNAHHAAHRYVHPRETAVRQRELVKGQHPHATILSCADSRVPPEIVFDQGLGDLFTVRSAGNVAGDIEIGSLEYAVAHLDTPLLVVMGHQGCGAVTAAVEGGEALGHTSAFIAPTATLVGDVHVEAGRRPASHVRTGPRQPGCAWQAPGRWGGVFARYRKSYLAAGVGGKITGIFPPRRVFAASVLCR